MLLTELRIRDNERQHARDERLRIHQHLHAIREARRAARSPNPIRRRLGASLVRLGRRVAGESFGAPALTP